MQITHKSNEIPDKNVMHCVVKHIDTAQMNSNVLSSVSVSRISYTH